MRFPAFFHTRHGTFLTFPLDEDTLQCGTSLKLPERDRKSGWEENRQSGEAVADLKKHTVCRPATKIYPLASKQLDQRELPIMGAISDARTPKMAYGPSLCSWPCSTRSPSLGWTRGRSSLKDIALMPNLLCCQKRGSQTTAYY